MSEFRDIDNDLMEVSRLSGYVFFRAPGEEAMFDTEKARIIAARIVEICDEIEKS